MKRKIWIGIYVAALVAYKIIAYGAPPPKDKIPAEEVPVSAARP